MKARFATTTALIVGATILLAPPASHANLAPSADDEALLIQSAGLDALLMDDRDAGLRRALKMLGPRLAHLPVELQDPGAPPGFVFQMVVDMFFNPLVLNVAMDPEADPQREMPFQIALSSTAGDAAAARDRMSALTELLSQMNQAEPQAVPGEPNAKMFELGGASMVLSEVDAEGRPAMSLRINRDRHATLSTAPSLLPAGATTTFRMHFDASALKPILEMILAQQPGQQAEMMRAQFQMAGLLSDTPMSLALDWGHTPARSVWKMRYDNYTANAMYAAILPTSTLSQRDLALEAERYRRVPRAFVRRTGSAGGRSIR